MINAYIKSPDDKTYNRICYVMKHILLPIGVPFCIKIFEERVERVDGKFSILCVPIEQKNDILSKQLFDLVIPYENYAKWINTNIKINMDKVEGIPVLYKGEIPKFFIQEGQVGFDLINLVFFLLSRQEEYLYKHRDSFDRFSANYSILYEHGILRTPIINYYIKSIETYIHKYIKFLKIPKWKNNSPYAVILSHDVDHLPSKDFNIILKKMTSISKKYGFLSGLRYMLVQSGNFLSYTKLPEYQWQFADWIDKEKKFGFRSTFFLSANKSVYHKNDTEYSINSKIKYNGKNIRLSDIGKFLIKNGWEIGLHGSINAYKDQKLLSEEMKTLEENLDCKILGIRQHYLMFDINSTWQIQENLGFSYDTTLGFAERSGFRAGIAFPFTPYNLSSNRKYKLLELPMCIMDSSLFFLDGEMFDIERSIQRCQGIIDDVKQTSGLLVINFHPHFFVSPYTDWWKVYQSILDRIYQDNAWVATCKEITEWWINKYHTNFGD